MDDMITVRQAVDRLLGGDLGPMLDLLAEDVQFEVAGGGDSPEYRRETGRQAVVDYFTSLGELVAFWQIDYGVVEGQVIAWGKERFTAEPCGLEGACEFALVFDLTGGMIGRFLVIEDLTVLGTMAAWPRSAEPATSVVGGSQAEAPASAPEVPESPAGPETGEVKPAA